MTLAEAEKINPPCIVNHGRGKGTNLLLLLGLPVSSRVLLIGAALHCWLNTFPDGLFFWTWVDPQVKDDKYDLVIYHSGCASNRNELALHFNKITGFLREGGGSIVLARNFYSIATLQMFKSSGREKTGNYPWLGHTGIRRILERVGIKCRHEFLALPFLEDGEEFVQPGSRFLELPHHWHPLLHGAHRLGIYRFIADGSAYVSLTERIENGPLMQAVTGLITGSDEGLRKVRFRLERFDLRLRGALVLFLSELTTGQEYIARVVHGEKALSIIRRNHIFLNNLRSASKLLGKISSVLPLPVGELTWGEGAVFVETLMWGVPAWKVNRARVRERIFHEASNFILQFQIAHRRLVVLDQHNLNRLFDGDLQQIEHCPTAESEILDGVTRIVSKAKNALLAQKLFLTLSHGDFGYGNILVNPKNGQVAGVVDWDTGRADDLPGIDFLNMMVQRCRTEKGSNIFSSFVEVASEVIARRCLDEDGIWERELGVTEDLSRIFLHVALIRYMSRSAQYPEVFASEQENYKKALDFLQKEVRL